MCSLVWRGRLYPTNPNSYLAQKCGRLEVSFARSMVCSENARIGLFFRRKFEKKVVVGSYCGSLALTDPGKRTHLKKQYAEERNEVMEKLFCK